MTERQWRQQEAGGYVNSFEELGQAGLNREDGTATSEDLHQIEMAGEAITAMAMNSRREWLKDRDVAADEIRKHGEAAVAFYTAVRPAILVGLNVTVRRRSATVPRVRRDGSGRPRERHARRAAARSSSRSGDSGDDGSDSEPPASARDLALTRVLWDAGLPVSEAAATVNAAKATLDSTAETLELAVARVLQTRARLLEELVAQQVAELDLIAQGVTA